MGNHANARVFYKPSSTSPFATKAQIRPKFGESYGNPYSARSPHISDLGPSCSGIVNIVSRSGSAVLQRPHGQKITALLNVHDWVQVSFGEGPDRLHTATIRVLSIAADRTTKSRWVISIPG